MASSLYDRRDQVKVAESFDHPITGKRAAARPYLSRYSGLTGEVIFESWRQTYAQPDGTIPQKVCVRWDVPEYPKSDPPKIRYTRYVHVYNYELVPTDG